MITGKNAIVLENLIVQKEGNIISDMDGEKVMLSIENGKYYNLGSIGGVIWDYLFEPITVENLILDLQAEFEVEYAQCEADVLPFLQHLYEEKLIKIIQK